MTKFVILEKGKKQVRIKPHMTKRAGIIVPVVGYSQQRKEGKIIGYEPTRDARGIRTSKPIYETPKIDEKIQEDHKKVIERADLMAKRYGFSKDEQEDGTVIYSTRDSGDVGEGTPGQADISRASAFAKELKEKFPNSKIYTDTVDEWVDVTVEAPPTDYYSKLKLARETQTAYEQVKKIGNLPLKKWLGFHADGTVSATEAATRFEALQNIKAEGRKPVIRLKEIVDKEKIGEKQAEYDGLKNAIEKLKNHIWDVKSEVESEDEEMTDDRVLDVLDSYRESFGLPDDEPVTQAVWEWWKNAHKIQMKDIPSKLNIKETQAGYESHGPSWESVGKMGSIFNKLGYKAHQVNKDIVNYGKWDRFFSINTTKGEWEEYSKAPSGKTTLVDEGYDINSLNERLNTLHKAIGSSVGGSKSGQTPNAPELFPPERGYRTKRNLKRPVRSMRTNIGRKLKHHRPLNFPVAEGATKSMNYLEKARTVGAKDKTPRKKNIESVHPEAVAWRTRKNMGEYDKKMKQLALEGFRSVVKKARTVGAKDKVPRKRTIYAEDVWPSPFAKKKGGNWVIDRKGVIRDLRHMDSKKVVEGFRSGEYEPIHYAQERFTKGKDMDYVILQKGRVQVKPYTRRGRPVRGYSRKTLREMLYPEGQPAKSIAEMKQIVSEVGMGKVGEKQESYGGFKKLKTITSHVGYFKFLADVEHTPFSIPRTSIPSPYAYSPVERVLNWNGKNVIVKETSHKHYEVFEVPPSIPLQNEEDIIAQMGKVGEEPTIYGGEQKYFEYDPGEGRKMTFESGKKLRSEGKIAKQIEENQTKAVKFIKLETRNSINKMLHALGIYHPEIPLKQVFDIVEQHGLKPLQEDNTEWEGFLLGREASVMFPLGPMGSAVTHSETHGNWISYEPVKNANLQLQWYKMPSGKYEITVFVA